MGVWQQLARSLFVGVSPELARYLVLGVLTNRAPTGAYMAPAASLASAASISIARGLKRRSNAAFK